MVNEKPKMPKIMVKETRKHPANKGCAVIVDYNFPFKDLLNQRREYNVSPEINSINFPTNKKGKKQITVRWFSLKCRPVIRSPGFEREIMLIEEKGYEPVNSRELISATNQYERVPLSSPMMAFGEPFDIGNSLMVLCVSGIKDSEKVNLYLQAV